MREVVTLCWNNKRKRWADPKQATTLTLLDEAKKWQDALIEYTGLPVYIATVDPETREFIGSGGHKVIDPYAATHRYQNTHGKYPR